MRGLNVAFVLFANAVPLVGVRVFGWSIGTVLLLYWLENLLVAAFTCARIVLHRALTRCAGHYRRGQLGGITVNGVEKRWGLLGEYAAIAFPFTLVHGLFVAAIVFLIAADKSGPEWHFSAAQFRSGALQMLAVLGIDFAVDALTMRSRPFAWIKAYVGRRMGRILILHVGIIVGFWAMAATDSPIGVLYVIIALKTLWELAAGYAGDTALPPRPPAWALTLADRLGSDRGGSNKMLEDWRRSVDNEQRQALEDEAVAR